MLRSCWRSTWNPHNDPRPDQAALRILPCLSRDLCRGCRRSGAAAGWDFAVSARAVITYIAASTALLVVLDAVIAVTRAGQ